MTEVSAAPQTLLRAAPFWASLGLVPVIWCAAVFGGWTLLLVPIGTWILFSLLDTLAGLETSNADPGTPDSQIAWHTAITRIWAGVQGGTIFGVIAYVTWRGHLATWELVLLAIGLGVMSGTIGITYAHELMHQRNRTERWLGDILMAMALYGHFRSEHLLVHHRYVGTPKDQVTARVGESFHRFFPRVLVGSLRSAWRAETALLKRGGMGPFHRRNPFWRYATLQAGFVALAVLVGGWTGLAMFLIQALVAISELELVNYVEHYGLTRKHLGDGRYEPVKPRHSWNASHKVSNWLLINLQRHSDHHYKPDRRFPLLQTYAEEEAPQLPHGYPVMTLLALVPPVWRRVMNPRVTAWRSRFYPEVTDWSAYDQHATPMPR